MMHQFARHRAFKAVMSAEIPSTAQKSPNNQEIQDAIKRLELFNRTDNHIVNRPAPVTPSIDSSAAKDTKPKF